MTETFFILVLPCLGKITLSASSLISLIGIVVSLVASLIAIFISVASLKQNSKMIEESSRPIIGIYSESVNFGSPTFYLVIKNFGNSLAVITKFKPDFDFSDCYGFRSEKNWLNDFSNVSIAPGQSHICRLEYDKITRPVTFEIEYKSGIKTYSDKITVDLKAGASMLTAKTATEGKELRTISYTLQEMVQKNL